MKMFFVSRSPLVTQSNAPPSQGKYFEEQLGRGIELSSSRFAAYAAPTPFLGSGRTEGNLPHMHLRLVNTCEGSFNFQACTGFGLIAEKRSGLY
jgi:hypothetical protein